MENNIQKSQVLTSLNWRYAVKKFDSSKKLSQQQVDVVLEAFQLTPTSMGLQLMKMLVVEQPNVRKNIREVSYNQMQVEESSHLLVFCRRASVNEQDIDSYMQELALIRNLESTSDALNGLRSMLLSSVSMDPVQQTNWMENQVYIALGNVLTVCALEGIDACPMEGFHREALDELLDLKSKGLQSVVMCPIGVRAADDKYAGFGKVRRLKTDIIEYI